ncbi:MAG TPA: hypothetical protein VMT34_07470 [Aggregatilineales bacterium]|nr:hypothetical protein [Aggregatilineales bacterium]
MRRKLEVVSGIILVVILVLLWPAAGDVAPLPRKLPPLLVLKTADVSGSSFGGSTPELPPGRGFEGDLYAWYGPGQPMPNLTNWGYNRYPVISPDGNYVAYASEPEKTAPWSVSGRQAVNLWVHNIVTGEGFRIAEQPPNANYYDHSAPPIYTTRPQPAWSPDSRSLAWGEIDQEIPRPGGNGTQWVYQLVIYDLATRSQRVIVPSLNGLQLITDGTVVDWGPAGILLASANAEPYSTLDGVDIYDPEGKPLLHRMLTGYGKLCWYEPALAAIWVTDDGKQLAHVCVLDADGSPQELLIDPVSGEVTRQSGALERYSLTAPEGIGLFLTPAQDAPSRLEWNMFIPGTPPVKVDTLSQNNFPLRVAAIAPDGHHAAFLTDQGIKVYDDNGQITPVDIPLHEYQVIVWIGWGPTGWRIRHP